VQVANHAGTKALLKALSRTKKPAQTVPLLQGIGRRGSGSPDEALGTIIDYLTDRDDAVRVAASQALARFSHPKGVEPLITALAGEKEGGRVFRMFVRQLQILTGQKIGPYIDPWQRWWRENKETVLAGGLTLGTGKPISTSDSKGGRFYGIPQRELRIIYVLDISGSMEVDMNDPKWVKGRSVASEYREDSRLGHAIRELLRAAKKLRKGTTYTVIFYADHASALWSELRAADDKSYNELKRELDSLEAGGSTNTYEAIDLALRVGGVHPDVPKASQKADAIYLVSDGAPTNASGKPENEGERTLAAARQWNALRRIVIHTIGIGREHSAGFMGALAGQNDGDYYAVQPKKRKQKRKSDDG
jgi:Mg-chelatase subunit ChlD